MKYHAVVIMFLVLCPLALGQSGEGYAFFAPSQIRGEGGSAFVTHFGGGGRWTAKSGVGFGAELGIGGPKCLFSGACAGVFSLNGYYVFRTSNEKLQPFVTGGYTRIFARGSGSNLGNFGAGVTYWAAPRVGLLVEFHDHIAREDSTIQIYGVRLGVAFK